MQFTKINLCDEIHKNHNFLWTEQQKYYREKRHRLSLINRGIDFFRKADEKEAERWQRIFSAVCKTYAPLRLTVNGLVVSGPKKAEGRHKKQ
jgi:hypothetical protein